MSKITTFFLHVFLLPGRKIKIISLFFFLRLDKRGKRFSLKLNLSSPLNKT
jgi:hypothetical protein